MKWNYQEMQITWVDWLTGLGVNVLLMSWLIAGLFIYFGLTKWAVKGMIATIVLSLVCYLVTSAVLYVLGGMK